MRKVTVMMVDDEILAMEHMRRLVDWDSLGFEVKDCVSNLKKTLLNSLELQPHLMIRHPDADHERSRARQIRDGSRS